MIIFFLVFLDEGIDGLNVLAANLSMNESGAGGAVGPGGIGKPGGTGNPGCTGKPGGTGNPGDAGNPGCANGGGCTSRTGLEDSINNLSMNETSGAEGAIGDGGIRNKEVIEAGGYEGAIVAPYSGSLFPAYSSKVGRDKRQG